MHVMHTSCVMALSLFLEQLDKRVDAQQKDMKKHVPERRVRIIGESADSHPPSDAPQWTVDTAWIEGYLLNPPRLCTKQPKFWRS